MSTEVSVTALDEVRELIAEGQELGAVPLSRLADVVEAADLSEEQQEPGRGSTSPSSRTPTTP